MRPEHPSRLGSDARAAPQHDVQREAKLEQEETGKPPTERQVLEQLPFGLAGRQRAGRCSRQPSP